MPTEYERKPKLTFSFELDEDGTVTARVIRTDGTTVYHLVAPAHAAIKVSFGGFGVVHGNVISDGFSFDPMCSRVPERDAP